MASGAGSGTWYMSQATGIPQCQPKIRSSGGLVLGAFGSVNGPAGGGGGTGGSGSGGINTLATILADMQNPDEDRPHGVPTFYSWGNGPTCGVATPANPGAGWAGPCTAGTYGGQIYFGSAGPGTDTNTRVQLRMIEMYVHSVSQNKWFLMMQANGQFSGQGINAGQFIEDYYNNEAVPANIRDEATNGGGASFLMTKQQRSSPTPNGAVNYNVEFFGNIRSSIPIANTDVDCGFTTMQARLILNNPGGPDDRHLANYVVNQEFDWWLNLTVGYLDGKQNPGGAQGRFRKVPTDGSWVAANAWNGPLGQVTTWGAGTFDTGLTLAAMQATPPPINAMGS